MSQRIFVSHAACDKPLIDALRTMLATAVGLNPTEIFYSSGAGTGIPAGKNFIEYMRDAMNDATFVISVITPAYLESEFCLAELGAVWYAADKDFYPTCVPSVDRARLKATLTAMQIDEITDAAALSDLLQRVCVHYGRDHVAAACTAETQVFLAALPGVLANLSEPTRVPAERVAELDAVNVRLVDQLTKARESYQALEQRYGELERAKTAEEIAAIAPVGDTDAQIAALLDAAQIAVYRLDSTVKKALPYELKGEGMPWPHVGDYAHDGVREAIDQGYLTDGDDGCVYVSDQWPDIEKAVDLLRDLQSLLRSLDDDGTRWFRETYRVPPDLRQGAVFDELF